MPSVKIGSDNAVEIDRKKRAIEAKNAKDLQRIFNNMADDAASLFKATGRVNALQLAENYKVEFIKEIRDIMRKTLKIFGFSIRHTLQDSKHFFFDLENKLLEIDLDFKRVVELEEVTDSQIDAINRDFLLASALFVANESEKQSEMITETNQKEIEAAFVAAGAFYSTQLNKARERQQELQARALFNQDAQNEADSVAREIAKMEAAKTEIIAGVAQKDLKQKAIARSELIAEQNVGLTESWSRQKEAELVNSAELVTTTQAVVKIEKTWNAILDSRVREAHAQADGQTVPVDSFFLVGGEQLKYPRDPNGSASNVIRCRCVSEQSVVAGIKSFEKVETKDIDLKPTEEMAKVAKRALEWRDKYDRGGTPVGVARARDISNRANLSKETVGRMVSFFARHRNNRSEFYDLRDGIPTTWRIAWDLWGGNPGDSWSKNKWEQLNR